MSAAIPMMTHLTRHGALEEAVVVELEDRRVVADAGGRSVEAEVALSCVVAPCVGDVVLLGHSTGTAWVLAVLRRPSEARGELAFDRDVALRARGTLSTESEHLELAAKTARASLGEATLFAKTIHTVADHARSVAKKVEGLFGVVSERMQARALDVEGACVTRAGDVDLQARGTVAVKGRHATVVADELVRFDGEQILMG